MGGKNLKWKFEKILSRFYIHFITTVAQSKKSNIWNAINTYSYEGIWGIPYKDRDFLTGMLQKLWRPTSKKNTESHWLSRTQPYTSEIKIIRFWRSLWLLVMQTRSTAFPRGRHCNLGITGTNNSAVRIIGVLLIWGALEPLKRFTHSHLLFQRPDLKNWVGHTSWSLRLSERTFVKRIC